MGAVARGYERKPTLYLLALWCFAGAPAPAAVLYVDLNSANPTPPYTNWAAAAANIHAGVGPHYLHLFPS